MDQPTSLASIYQARKNGDKDSSTTVEVLKRQFQDQIERILQEKGNQITKSHIPSSNEREVRNFKKLEREKSFDEARLAVQSQIEKIFEKAKNNQQKLPLPKPGIIKCGLATPLAMLHPVITPEDVEEDRGLSPIRSSEPLLMPTPSSLNQRMLQKSNLSSSNSHGETRSQRSTSRESSVPPPPPPISFTTSPRKMGSLYLSHEEIRNPIPSGRSSTEDDKKFHEKTKWKSSENLSSSKSKHFRGLFHQQKKTFYQPWHRDRQGPKSFLSMSQLDQLKKNKDFEALPINYKEKRKKSLSSSANSLHKAEKERNYKAFNNDRTEESSRLPIAHKISPKKPSDERADGVGKEDLSSSINQVEYLGSLPLSEKATDLRSLQIPVKELYFTYLDKVIKTNEKSRRRKGNMCILEIASSGLKLAFSNQQKQNESTFNPFPTIAVWAAVRFVYRENSTNDGTSFAFLPLISDPGDQEKDSLFHPLSKSECSYIRSDINHPPLFACIMRRNGVPRRLECHGFVCDTEEKAISIAADLFKALMASVDKKKKKSSDKKRKVRRVRRMNSTVSSKSSILSLASPSVKRRSSIIRQGRLKASKKANRGNDKKSKPSMEGDIYTKVAMPRSRSFMNVNGQFNLQDLFKELKDKEGIESVDDVLRLVISPNGISFNKIPPMYRNLLMKLIMSMSKDEIFIRSKNIMMEELKNSSKKKKKGFLLSKPKNKFKTKDFEKELKKLQIGNPTPIDLSKIESIPPSKAIDLNLIKKTHERSIFVNAKPIYDLDSSLSSTPSSSKMKRPSRTPKGPNIPENPVAHDSIYKSCSECGYQSVCGTNCSCSYDGSLQLRASKTNSSQCTCKGCEEESSYSYCSSCSSIVSRSENDKFESSSDESDERLMLSSETTQVNNDSPSTYEPQSDEFFLNSASFMDDDTKTTISSKTLSSDSLTSSCCSSSLGLSEKRRDDSTITRGPRPAYSETNMHNSLGYLP